MVIVRLALNGTQFEFWVHPKDYDNAAHVFSAWASVRATSATQDRSRCTIRGDMSSDVYVPLLAVFAAAILTAGGSRWIAGFQSKKAAEQERARIDAAREEARRADERSLRDGKRERLRDDYVAIVWAAENIDSASKQLAILWGADTPEARNQRIQDQLADAHTDLGRAMIRLRLEEGTQPIVDAYQRVRESWFEYADEVPRADRDHDHRRVAELLRAMEADLNEIMAAARADLDRLGKAI